jgi:hypothetical protein
MREFSASIRGGGCMGRHHDYWQASRMPCFKFIAKSAEDQLRIGAEAQREL